MVYTYAMRTASPAFLALLLIACKADLDWQGSPAHEGTREYLEAYKESYFRELGDRFVATWSLDTLLSSLGSVRVLYLGDHHENPTLHAYQLRLLDRIARAGVPVALGLEAVGTQDRPAVEEFMRGGTTRQLRSRIGLRWPGSWLEQDQIDGGFYLALLEAARQRQWPVFALEPTPRLPLAQRDETIAANIRDASRRHPDRLLVVVVGQAHLLGEGRLIDRVDLPHLAIGAGPSEQLLHSISAPRTADDFLRSSSGVFFFAAMVRPQP